MSNLILGRLLGASRLSEVFQAHIDGRNVALKRCLDPKHRNLLQREFDCLKTLHHPNIIKVHDWIEETSSTDVAFTMTQLHGVNGKVLAERLQRLPSAERHRRIISIGLQLCSALSHIHNAGWIHRDIKPSNLMFEQEYKLLLIDFGTVIKYPMSKLSEMIGTPRYASPEQLQKQSLTPLSDQFSMGATLYYLLLNKRPFESQDRSVLMKPSLTDPSVPAHLEHILLKCLALDPSNRFDSIEDIMFELNRVNPSDQPLAGREGIIRQIAYCMQRVHQGEQLHVHFIGTNGSGKKWAKETLCDAAHQQGLHTYFLDPSYDSKELLLERMADRFPLIACSISPDFPKLGIPLVEIHIKWLSLSQLRRSLFSYAPKTPDLTVKAQWLHRQTEGIPALLLPMLTEYTIRDAFHIPQDPEQLLPKGWVMGLSTEQWNILQALTYLERSLSTTELITMLPTCTTSILVDLEHRSLIKKQTDLWGISCLLVSSYIHRHHPVETQTLQTWKRFLTVSLKQIDSFKDIDLLSAKGKLAAAKSHGEQWSVKATGDNKSALLVDLGQVYLDMGNFLRAATVLADATTMSSLKDNPATYLRSQALRGRASLEQHHSSPIGAMHAIDRLSKLLSYNDPWVQTVWQWSLGALGDLRQWNTQLKHSIDCLDTVDEHHKIRCAFNLIRGACCIGDIECAKTIITSIEPLIHAYPLLEWEVHRVNSMITETPPPIVGTLVYELTAQEILLFKKRWVRVKGKHPDPTWYQ